MLAYRLRRLPDETLGSRLASGEAAAFDELYRRYVHRLAAYGAQLLGDGAAGDDVAQSALLKAYGALRAGHVPTNLRPWLYRIAHNAAVDMIARRRDVLDPAALEAAAVEPDGDAGALAAAVAGLPDRQRRVYVLRELHGLRIDETAAELGLTAAQVEQALFAARNRLAELLTFGERLSCVAVRRLAAGPLDAQERRALKTHVRSCPQCREALGPAGAASLPLLDWLRALPGLLVGGGAPVVAKVGVVAATATVGLGGPLAYKELHEAHPRPHLAVPSAAAATRKPVERRSARAGAAPATTVAASPPAGTTTATTTAATAAAALVEDRRTRHDRERRHHGRTSHAVGPVVVRIDGSSGVGEGEGEDGGRGPGSSGRTEERATPPVTVSVLTTSSSDGGVTGGGATSADGGSSGAVAVTTSDDSSDGSGPPGSDDGRDGSGDGGSDGGD